MDAAAIGAALTAIREQLDTVRTLKAQLTSISTATKQIWTGLDAMRSNILARVAEAESRRSEQLGLGLSRPSRDAGLPIGTAPTRTASLALTGTTGS